MIISVENAKNYVPNKSDQELELMLQALEQNIRNYTNNRFHQKPLKRIHADVIAGVFIAASVPFSVGDTIHVTKGEEATDCGVYTIKEIQGDTFTVKEDVDDFANIKVTKVKYGADIKLGVINLLKWEADRKVGIQSETISRHSVTYFNMDGDNSTMGYPKSLLGFLKPYMKARF